MSPLTPWTYDRARERADLRDISQPKSKVFSQSVRYFVRCISPAVLYLGKEGVSLIATRNLCLNPPGTFNLRLAPMAAPKRAHALWPFPCDLRNPLTLEP